MLASIALDNLMQSQAKCAWDAPWEVRREAGRADIQALGVKATLGALVEAGWDEDQAADWLLEAALGAELAGQVILLPVELRLISEDDEAWLRYRAGRHRTADDDLVGVKEAAEILGWDPRRVTTYRSRGSFPEPVAELAMGPVWLRRQIEEYKKQKQQD